MSRIIRPPVVAGETTDATTLNSTYDDYSQAGGLNQFNTRDQAFGIPHLAPDVKLIKNTGTVQLGTGATSHSSTPVVVDALQAGSTVHPVEDGAGNPTQLNMGLGWTINSGECLRVWWNLSVQTTNINNNPFWNTSPDALGLYSVPNSIGPGSQQLSDGFHCWLAYIEWDITSVLLNNWVPVPGQAPPTSSFDSGTYTGLRVADMNASTVISPWTLTSYSHGTKGEMPVPQQGTRRDHGWYAPYGMYVHAPGAPVTVYGIRLVLVGILHPIHNLLGDEENILVFDYNLRNTVGPPATFPTLLYLSGRMAAVHMSMG